jgi:hypothetical protein
MASWLAAQVPAITQNEAAGEFFADIRNAVDQIERAINRPIPDRFLGPCPSQLQDGLCDTTLMADRKAQEVTCPSCKIVHDVDAVERQLWERVDEWLLTPQEIHMIMEYFGEPVPASTIRRWKMEGRLVVRGWRDGKPRYWPGDVRRLRKRDTRAKTTATTSEVRYTGCC